MCQTRARRAPAVPQPSPAGVEEASPARAANFRIGPAGAALLSGRGRPARRLDVATSTGHRRCTCGRPGRSERWTSSLMYRGRCVAAIPIGRRAESESLVLDRTCCRRVARTTGSERGAVHGRSRRAVDRRVASGHQNGRDPEAAIRRGSDRPTQTHRSVPLGGGEERRVFLYRQGKASARDPARPTRPAL